MDSDCLDDSFPQDPGVRSIRETDIVSGRFESLFNYHPNLLLGMQEQKSPESLSAGLFANEQMPLLPIEMSSEKVMSLSKLTQSSKSKAILSLESPLDTFALKDNGESDINDVPNTILPDENPVKRKGGCKPSLKASISYHSCRLNSTVSSYLCVDQCYASGSYRKSLAVTHISTSK
jgi:hypothetical protein